MSFSPDTMLNDLIKKSNDVMEYIAIKTGCVYYPETIDHWGRIITSFEYRNKDSPIPNKDMLWFDSVNEVFVLRTLEKTSVVNDFTLETIINYINELNEKLKKQHIKERKKLIADDFR